MEQRKEINMDMVTGLMDKNYSLTYVDYRENLNSRLDTIEKCINKQSGDSLFEDIDDWYCQQKLDTVEDIMESLKKELVKAGYKKWEAGKFFEENREEIEESIYSRNDSAPLQDLLRNTDDIPVRVVLISDYDCINSHWLESSGGYSYEESYFGDMVDALNLNPRKVKRILLEHGEKIWGGFPDKRSRNREEQVSYEQFYEELENSTCGANLLTYVATVRMQELYDADFKLPEIIISKGNKCGIYSSMQGGGSLMEMELIQDVRLILKAGDFPYFRR